MRTGHDVGSTRLDDLDRIIIRNSLVEPFEPRVFCNFGSGRSKLSRALGALGHQVYNYDHQDFSVFFNIEQSYCKGQHFIQTDLGDIKPHHLPTQVDALIFQRVLHYFPYHQAVKIINVGLRSLRCGGKVYISVSGLDSEIGVSYSGRNEPLATRWASIEEACQKKFAIEQEVCLYSQDDLEQLVGDIEGMKIENLEVSKFGNIKCVISRH